MKQLESTLDSIFELASQGITIEGLPEEALTLFEKIASIARYQADVVGVAPSEDISKK